MARPTKLTDKVQKRLTDALRAGNTRRAACAFAGISEDSLARWEKAGGDFQAAVAEAEASAEVRAVALIQQAAGSGNWRAAVWWLERRRPNEWGARAVEAAEVQGPVEIHVDLTRPEKAPADMTDEELQTKIGWYAAGRPDLLEAQLARANR